jgi:hypothetical protein
LEKWEEQQFEHRKPMPIGADAEKLAATLQFFKLTEYIKNEI